MKQLPSWAEIRKEAVGGKYACWARMRDQSTTPYSPELVRSMASSWVLVAKFGTYEEARKFFAGSDAESIWPYRKPVYLVSHNPAPPPTRISFYPEERTPLTGKKLTAEQLSNLGFDRAAKFADGRYDFGDIEVSVNSFA